MKRKLLAVLCTAVLSLSLVACGGSDEKKDEGNAKTTATEMKDGTFEAETKEADKNGGKAKVTVTVEGGKITKATYNEFTDKGNKRDDAEYNKMMKENSGTNPAEYEVAIEKQIVDKQSAEIDGVSGATSSSDKAKTLFKEAINNSIEGNTEKELVDVK